MRHPNPTSSLKSLVGVGLVFLILSGWGVASQAATVGQYHLDSPEGVELPNSPSAISGTVGLWHFNEGSGTTTADSSGNGNNGSWTANTLTDNFSTSANWSSSGTVSFNISQAGQTTVRLGAPAWSNITRTVYNNGSQRVKVDVYLTATSTPHLIAFESDDGRRWAILHSGNFYVQGYFTGCSYCNLFNFPMSAPLNTWHTVEIAYDTTGKVEAWVYPQGGSRNSTNYYSRTDFPTNWNRRVKSWSNVNYSYLANYVESGPDPTWTTAGKFQKALSFAAVDKFLVGTINRPTNTFTFEAWVKAEITHEIDPENTTGTGGTSGQRYVFGSQYQGGTGSSSNSGAGLSVGTNGISVYEHAASYMPALAVYSASIGTGWNHIAVVYNNKKPSIYLNGVLVRTGLTSPKTTVYAPIEIGGGAYGYHQGLIDEVAIYNRVLTSAEILDHYNRGRAQDTSGNGNHGNTSGPVSAAGKVNQALQFDGVDDYVQIPDSSSLSITNTGLSLEAWIRPNPSDGGAIIHKDNHYSMFLNNSGTLTYADSRTWSYATVGSYGSIPMDGATWTHVLVTESANGTTIKFYVNGSDVGTYTRAGGSLTDNANNVIIGSYNATTSFVGGRIDEVKIHNTALDACAIKESFTGLYKPDGIIDGDGADVYGAAGAGAGGSSTRTVTPGVMSSYALSVQNDGGVADSFTVSWNTPAGWTVVVNDGTTDQTSPFTTASLSAGAAAVYTLKVTPPSVGATTQNIVVDIVSVGSTCTPKRADSVTAVAVVQPSAGPAAPTGLTVTLPQGKVALNRTSLALSDSQLNLTWTDASNNETGFKVERATDSCANPFSQIAVIYRDTVQSAATGVPVYYANTGLMAGTTYCYRTRSFVRPIGAPSDGSQDIHSAYSNTATGTTTGSLTDTSPPSISNVAATNITASSATITWSTNEASDSLVQYGATAAYGSSTSLNASMVTSHSVNLSGLSANTLYHFRVKSCDAVPLCSYSGDFTFTNANGSGAVAWYPMNSPEGKELALGDLGPAPNLDANLKALWHLNEGTRALTSDSSGMGNNGKLRFIQFKSTTQETNFAPAGGQAVGVLATDGTYLYGQSWSSYDGNDHTINKIGTGYNGTTAGTDYGAVAAATSSLSMFYLNGYLYNGYTSNGSNLQRINVSTGAVDVQALPAPLLNRCTGENLAAASANILVTTDGTYVYNFAYARTGTGAVCNSTFNGWTLKVFDPSNSWALIRNITFGTSSYYTDGLVADGASVYPIEWTSSNSARVTALDATLGTQIAQWTINQGDNEVINGQYDWVNNKVWLGGLGNTAGKDRVYRYSGIGWTAGKFQKALSFDGVDDYVEVVDPGASALDLSGSLTLEAWIYWNGDSGSGTLNDVIIAKTNNGASPSRNNYRLVLNVNPAVSGGTTAQLRFNYADSAGTYHIFDSTANVITAGAWYHVVATYTSGVAGSAQLYVNGASVAGSWTSGTGSASLVTSNDPFSIGAAYNNGPYFAFFNGSIDEVAIYNTTLTSSQVLDHYHRGVAEDVTVDNANAFEANDGTILSPTSAGGYIKEALSFDGVDDYVGVGDPASGILDFGTGDFTISLWYNRDPNATTNLRLLSKGAGADSSAGYALFGSNTGVTFIIADGTNPRTSVSASGLATGTWYHLAATRQGAVMKIYINGTLSNTNSSGLTGSVSGTAAFEIGRNSTAGNVPFDGRMDEVKIFNRALPASEIAAEAAVPPLDTTPPAISGVAVNGTAVSSGNPTFIISSATTATITWQTTGDPSDSQVEYGTSNAYGSFSVYDSARVTNHSIVLTGLSPSTAYHVRVRSRDAAGNLSSPNDYHFTTSTNAAPVITLNCGTAIVPGSTTQTSVTIAWTTNEASDSQVEYGLTTSYGSITGLDTNMVTSHSVTVSGLLAGTTYNYRVRSRDAAGDLTTSGNCTFTTLEGDSGAPGTVSNLVVEPGSQRFNSINLTWTAPPDDAAVAGVGYAQSYDLRYSMLPIVDGIPGPGQVDWNDTTCTDSARPVDCVVEAVGEPTPQTAGDTEVFTVTGLMSNTIYYFALKSKDEVNNVSAMSNLAYCYGTTTPCGDHPTDGTLAGRTALRTEFNLVSVPLVPSPADPASVFGDDIGGTPYLSRWNSSGAGTTDGCYETSPTNGLIEAQECDPEVNIATLSPGLGYFLQGSGNNPVIDVPAGSADVTTSANCGVANTYAIPLDPQGGWNVIGDPFTERAPLGGSNPVRLRYDGNNGTCETFQAAATAGRIGGAIYDYNGSTYDALACNAGSCDAAMEPWRAYWMEVISGFTTTIELIVPDPTP